jgi:hypothetical protein
MSIKDPKQYRDKSVDWMTFFADARRRELSSLITPELLAEHLNDPRGLARPTSDSLQKVLNYLHNLPTSGKSFAYAVKPHDEYWLGIMHERGAPPTLYRQSTFGTERDAVHAVFVHRLTALGLMAKCGQESL